MYCNEINFNKTNINAIKTLLLIFITNVIKVLKQTGIYLVINDLLNF